MKMATDSSMLLYFAYFLHRTLVPKANSFLSSAAEHVIPGCSPYPFRHYLSRLTEIIPPLIPYPVRAYALFLPTSKKSVQAQFFISTKMQPLTRGEKSRHRAWSGPPWCCHEPQYVVVALRQVYPNIESLFDKQTFMSSHAALRACH
jgi:hypothetical protein